MSTVDREFNNQGEQGSFNQKSRLSCWLLEMADDWKGQNIQELYDYGDGLGLYKPHVQRSNSSYGSADCLSYNDRLDLIERNIVGTNVTLAPCIPSVLGHLGVGRCTLSDFDLKDMADVVIVKNLPHQIVVEEHATCERFVRENLLERLNIDNPHVTVVPGKLRGE